MLKNLVLDERELKEIHHSLFYREVLAHGTVGHNQLMLIAKLAETLGFSLDKDDYGNPLGLLFEDSASPKEVIISHANS
jgi:hypothetical protein